MKVLKALILVFLVILIPSFTLYAEDEPVPRSLIAFAEKDLAGLGMDPVVVREVQLQNREDTSLSEIKARDTEWQNYNGVSRFMLDLMSNDCALVLHNFENRYPYIVETFVTDRLGANVGQTEKTSDYWQGDEDKFTESFNRGKGAVYYGDIEFDSSSNEIVVQVSVPVMAEGTAVGTITFSISLDKWEKR